METVDRGNSREASRRGDAFKSLHGVGVLAGWLFDKTDEQIEFTWLCHWAS